MKIIANISNQTVVDLMKSKIKEIDENYRLRNIYDQRKIEKFNLIIDKFESNNGIYKDNFKVNGEVYLELMSL